MGSSSPDSKASATRSRATSTSTVTSAPASVCTSRDARSSTCGVASRIRRPIEPYDESTLQLVFSTTKGATAACANLLMQRGLLDVDAPVVSVLAGVRRRRQGEHPGAMAAVSQGRAARHRQAAVARRGPRVGSGRRRAVGAGAGVGAGHRARLPRARPTDGWSARSSAASTAAASARSSPRRSRSRSGSSSGSACPKSEEHRVAPLIGSLIPEGEAPERGAEGAARGVHGPDSVLGRALTLNGAFDMDCWNDRAVHAAEIGAANGITNARSLSRFYAGLVGPLPDAPAAPLFSPAQIDAARETPDRGQRPLPVLRDELRSGVLHCVAVRARTAAPARSVTRGPEGRWASPTPTTRSPRAM